MKTYSYTTQEVLDVLSAGGVKPSAQRILILRFLMENRIHPTVDEIFTALHPANPTLSRTTVYNTLRLLASSGVIRCIDLGGGDGSRWDFAQHDHAHFHCTSCANFIDIDFETLPKFICPDGYAIHSAEVVLKGICPECSRQASQIS